MDWIWDESERGELRMADRTLAGGPGKMDLPFMKFGSLWEGLVVRGFVLGHVKFEMSIGHPSREVKSAGGYKSGV